jgi:CheY-like chemotaxis protein
MHGRETAAGTRTDRIDAVLLVEADPEERERIGSVLEGCGYEVSVCPGPTGPDYTCVGSREGRCALTRPDAVIVLDMSLDSEALLTGTAAEELLALYMFGDHRIVVLGSHPGADVPGQLIRLPRHPEPSLLTAAVRSLEHHPANVGL